MAYFRKRGLTWSVTVPLPNEKGKRTKKELGGFRTKKEAQEAATALLAELQTGTYVRSSDITFDDFALNNWLPLYSKSVKPGSSRIRRNEIGIIIEYIGRGIKMQDISSISYERSILKVFDKYSRNTACGVCGTASMIFKKARKDGIIKIDPTEFFRVPRQVMTLEESEEADKLKYMEKSELAKFLQVAQEKGFEDDYLMLKLLAFTGMRIGELCALKWSDLDFDEHTLNINKTYYNPSNTPINYQLLPPKTRASKRKIDIDSDLIKELKEHKQHQQILRKKCPTTWHNKDFVFVHLDWPGYPKYPKILGYRMKRILKAAGLSETLSPHSLRHTHCSLLAEAGATLEEIQARLGQVDDDTTKKVYLHITKARQKDTSHKFSELMKSVL